MIEHDVLQKLIDLLALERLEENLFRGETRRHGRDTVYGGQVLGQALSAAVQTVPADRFPHSLHAYFLRPGTVDRPIIYEVDRIRDGTSFTTRRVVAVQKGRPIFNMSASFQVAEGGFEHQDAMPDSKGPDGLLSEQELAHLVKEFIPEKFRRGALSDRPIEARPVQPNNPMSPVVRDPHLKVWYRAARALPDDPALHCYLLAYASDFHFLPCALLPHGVSYFTPGMQVASVDHAMWFHRPFRLDDWLLHVVESPSASGARGLVRGRFFTRDGVLVASTIQEGLIRKRTP